MENTVETQKLSIVYFEQGLGAEHATPWLKFAFSCVLQEKHKKEERGRKFMGACTQRLVSQRFYYQKKHVYQVFQRISPTQYR